MRYRAILGGCCMYNNFQNVHEPTATLLKLFQKLTVTLKTCTKSFNKHKSNYVFIHRLYKQNIKSMAIAIELTHPQKQNPQNTLHSAQLVRFSCNR